MKTCLIEMCNKKAIARGMCSAHYSRWQRHGDTTHKSELKTLNKNLNCVVPKCERKRHVKELCNTHYMKVKRSGTLEPLRDKPEWKHKRAQNQLSELSRLDPTPCGGSRRGSLAMNTFHGIKAKARIRGIPFDLNPFETYFLFISPCYYCGRKSNWPNDRNGIDRIDNTKGYLLENSVTCCSQCNSAKGTSSQSEFYNWAKSLFSNLKERNFECIDMASHSAEWLAKVNAASQNCPKIPLEKPIEVIETGQRFKSVKDAAKVLGIKRPTLSVALKNGGTNRSLNFTFRYL